MTLPERVVRPIAAAYLLFVSAVTGGLILLGYLLSRLSIPGLERAYGRVFLAALDFLARPLDRLGTVTDRAGTPERARVTSD